MNRVIYINYQPISKKYFADFYLYKCIEKGLIVEYWDLSSWFFPEVESKSDFTFSNIKYISSRNELKNNLKIVDCRLTLFFPTITYQYKVRHLFICLSAHKCQVGFFARGMFPTPASKSFRKIKFSISMIFSIPRKLENFYALFLKKIKIIKAYDIIFLAGSESAKTLGVGSSYDFKSAKIINVNYFDFDDYLGANKIEAFINSKYCVFIDQNLAYHPDIIICGLKNINATTYFLDLNNYFTYIERKFDVKVIIAAHPKSHNYLKMNPFQGRDLYFDKTCELVKNSMFVLTHHSTAISYAILFQKPIIFLNSFDIKMSMPDLYYLTQFLAEYLYCEVINFDDFDKSYNYQFDVNNFKYNIYKYKYLTSVYSENTPSHYIFIQSLIDFFNKLSKTGLN